MENIQDILAQSLSGGQKRKLTFGIAILGDPQVRWSKTTHEIILKMQINKLINKFDKFKKTFKHKCQYFDTSMVFLCFFCLFLE